MQIMKRVLIKQVITEKSKEVLREQFARDKIQLERECQQLLFEQRKLKNKLGPSKTEITERFQQEIKHRKDKIMVIDFKMEQLELLEIGSEIIEKEVDGLVDVKVGMRWDEIVGKKSIVIEDDIVIRIDHE
ncbi:YlqD family protein [Pseudogracilibacillus auburnensis]|uniref:YlqD protein n=1 Tax=Pseudogracilibacillus auburnensis TaxID=1494959 RepID=A0A2V3W2L6_9BACI|nr:YlqD family protein [Pseudogracilibacillus auburnensis]MBO1003830.1 YlqD family protein [Pseudogracilibacillus auburnensis]PXW88583.1 YlqD protein [Pseudogracilibacillus auburnensis]